MNKRKVMSVTCMNSVMTFKLPLLGEGFSTFITVEGFFPCGYKKIENLKE